MTIGMRSNVKQGLIQKHRCVIDSGLRERERNNVDDDCKVYKNDVTGFAAVSVYYYLMKSLSRLLTWQYS